MSDEIGPALTPEEWATGVVAGDEDEESASIADGAVICSGPSPDDEFVWGSAMFTGPRRHALAALALHGQSFGFTWEDVDALRDAADSPDLTGGWLYEDLADRIAALLPPREEGLSEKDGPALEIRMENDAVRYRRLLPGYTFTLVVGGVEIDMLWTGSALEIKQPRDAGAAP